MGTDKIIIHESIAEGLTKKLAAAALIWPMTSAVTEAGAAKTEALVRDALNQGATNVVPSMSPSNGTKAYHGNNLFNHSAQLRPTVLTGVKSSMRLYSEESFGPTLSVHTFNTEEEAIQLANETEYGLAASVFSQDIMRALRVAKRISAGAVHINSMTVHDEPQLPHGGMKSSGWGRFGVPWGEFSLFSESCWYLLVPLLGKHT